MSSRNFLMFIAVMYFSAVEAKTFTIKKGHHDAKGLQLGIFFGKEQKFSAKFNDSAIYDLGNVNQGDINKLSGFGDCYSGHHKNSARFGWRWSLTLKKVEIFAYVYHNAIRESLLVDTVDLNREYLYQIKVQPKTYLFTLNGKSVELPRGCHTRLAHGARLYPYFGGDEVAPHDITIDLDIK